MDLQWISHVKSEVYNTFENSTKITSRSQREESVVVIPHNKKNINLYPMFGKMISKR
jgi:hypothetical protein